MKQKQSSFSRKKFFLWGLGILSSVTALKWINSAKKKKNTVRMLTREGKLVEVDKELLATHGNKVTNEELRTWINRK